MSERLAQLLVGAVAISVLGAISAGLWLNHDDGQGVGPWSAGTAVLAVVVVVALSVNLAVGAVVALARRDNAVGWLFLLLGLVLVLEFPADEYVQHGSGQTGDLPASRIVVVLAGSTWILWFTIMALILLLTPTGKALSGPWGVVARAQAVAGALAFLAAIPSDKPIDPPYDTMSNPMYVAALQPWANAVGTVCVYAIALGLIASGVSLVLRFRRAQGDDRRQLLWLVFAAVPLPAYVVLAFVSSRHGADAVTILATGGFITVIPIAAGLSVLRFRLYDVDRVLTSTAVYSLLSAALITTYAIVVWLGAVQGTRWGAGPAISATAGAIAAVAIAAPLRRVIQTALDRRFNRRGHEARQVVRAGLAEEDPGIDLTGLFRRALGDNSVTVSYPADDGWVSPDGSIAPSAAAFVSVNRHDRTVARVGFDPARVDEATVARTASLAATELDNGRLRAEVARRLEEIDASRRRLTSAQRSERRRIERDLHDGAQQSLLALAFDLQSAQVNGDPDRMRAALAAGSTAARDAVRELRELANGLHPAALTDGGLPAALDDMARHSPVPLRLRVAPERFDPGMEFTAWLVLGEAIVNAQKHARAGTIDVGVTRENGHLRLLVSDDGGGGARPDGPGLRGLRDRVETARGELTVTSGPDGTTVEAVLPCGS